MAVITSLAALAAVFLFAFVCAALGCQFLRAVRLDLSDDTEKVLCATAVGFIFFEALLGLSEFVAPLLFSIMLILAAAVVVGASEWPTLWRTILRIFKQVPSRSLVERILIALVGFLLVLEGLVATAPMTGSDALHYHFATPMRLLRGGFHPNFFVTTSFLTGQGHLLILTGLALGSEKLAMGLLYLAGGLAAAGAACLASTWVSGAWAYLAALAFLLNPVVFWQISTAGVPDLWMAFFAVIGVLLIARARNDSAAGLPLVCGALAGGIAGTKYLGCIFATALLLAFLWEAPSLKRAALFLAGGLGTGVWPYARNLLWTGDPVFPFAMRWLAPGAVNQHALASLVAGTVVSHQRTLATLWKFPLFAAVNRADVGFWEFFGPFCLMFLPLFFIRAERNPHWRAALIVTITGGLGVGLTSGMARYTLPALPIALAASFAGAAGVMAQPWKFARGIVTASLVGFLFLGAGGFAVYSTPALRAAVGLTSREEYLRQRSPDYAVSEFVNQTLAGKEGEGNAMVFFRHLYYVRVPYLYGDPEDSWAVDPAHLATPEAWRDFMRRNRIRWIVRAPNYPEEICAPLEQMEHSGALVPVARRDVSAFAGNRILGIRKTVAAVIFRVND